MNFQQEQRMNDENETETDGMGAAGCLVIAFGISILLWFIIVRAGMALLVMFIGIIGFTCTSAVFIGG
jgi:hypothetical protein